MQVTSNHETTEPQALTLAMVRAELRAVGVSISKTDWDEYRVNFRGGNEATAYYTTGLEDARGTGLAMMRRHMAALVAGGIAPRQHISFEFDARNYEFTHGRAPKGYGSWAFAFEGRAPVWAPSSSYADAKRWIKQHIRTVAPADYRGVVVVEVCT